MLKNTPRLGESGDSHKQKGGRPTTYRWPGLESEARSIQSGAQPPTTRAEQLYFAAQEATAREQQNDTEFDFDSVKFSVEGGKHTTVDFEKIVDPNGVATVTTNDFVVFNRFRKLLKKYPDFSLIDIKFNQSKSAAFFVTFTCPLPMLRKIFTSYIE